MRRTTTSFETKLLTECVRLTKSIDRACFPQEMWLNDIGMDMLIQSKAESTILRHDGREIGQAITLPESAAAIILDGADKYFPINDKGVYSYSEAIIPEYQNKGYGTLLLAEIAIRMRERGFTSISAHVRTRHGWDKRRCKELTMHSTRLIHDFWDDPHEVVQYQAAQI